MKLACLAALAACAAVTVAPAAARGDDRVEEFGGFSNGAAPCEIEFDRKGNLWTELVNANAMGRVDTETGAIEEFPLPTPGGMPGGMELGPDGGIWFPEVMAHKIVRLEPTTGKMREFPMPWTSPRVESQYGIPASDDVTFGKDGALYFTLIGLNAIGRMDIKTGEMKKFDIPSRPAGPAIIQPGPGTLLLFGMIFTNKVGTLDTATGRIREYSVPGFPTQGVTLGPDNAIWYTSPLTQSFGRIDVETGDVTEYNIIALRRKAKLPLSPGSPFPTPTTIRTGGDGNIYFGQGGLLFPSFGNKIGKFNPRTKELTEIETPSPASTPCDQNSQKPDELWTGLFTANKVGRIKIDPLPELSYCRQVACPDSVPTAPPAKRRACSPRRRVTLQVDRRVRRQVVSARVVVGGRTLKRLRKGATSTSVVVRRKRKPVVVKLVARLRSGRTVTVTRRVGPCRTAA
jgi:virginiamycin B lyase